MLAVIRKIYPEIVSGVDVKGYILDTMIANDVISFEQRENIDMVSTDGDRARMLLKHIMTGFNKRAAICFLEALKHDYKDLADRLIRVSRESNSEGEDDSSSSMLAYNYYHFAS